MSIEILAYISLAAIISIMVAVFQYIYKQQHKNYTLLVLRALSIFGILLLFINPKIRKISFTNSKPILNILVDNSASISYIKENDNIHQLFNRLQDDAGLSDKFDLNFYRFSEDIHPLDSLTFDQGATNISQSLQTLKNLYDQRTEATILITDGNQNLGAQYDLFTDTNPIFPVVVGDTIRYEDLKISRVNANSYSNLQNELPVEIFVNYDGASPISTILTIKEGNKILFSKEVSLTKTKNSVKIQAAIASEKVGIHHYEVRLDALPQEKNTTNNQNYFSVEVIDQQAKILVLSSIEHPDLGLLKRAIETNKQRKVILKTTTSEDIQYSDYQLVIIYQPNSKFKTIFENILSENRNFLLITGSSTDWSFLNNAQPFFTKSYLSKTEEYSAIFNNSYDQFQLEDIGFSQFPPLESIFGEVNFKVPFQPILFQSIRGFETEAPLLCTFSSQETKRAALFGENLWKWRMYAYQNDRNFQKFDNFLALLVQYTSQNRMNGRLEVNYKPIIYANQPLNLSVAYYDANYQFDPNAIIKLKVLNSSNELVLEQPIPLQSASYETQISSLAPGDYSFSVTTNTSFTKTGRFKVVAYSIEQQFITSDLESLKSLANNTKGKLFNISNFDTLLDHLKTSEDFPVIQKSSEKITSLIDWRWLLFLIALLLSIEWFLRKYKGLI